MTSVRRVLGLLSGLLLAFLPALSPAATLNLDGQWRLQSGCAVSAGGARISSLRYHPVGWMQAPVPGTVLGAQVAAGRFPDPFFGMNLRAIPGTDYPLTRVFGYLPMSAQSPYRCPWWYRTKFAAPGLRGSTTSLHFSGINYRANLWLNGKKIASSDDVAGAFRVYDLDVSSVVKPGVRNALAVEVFAQTENDLGIDFLDWNPAPADKSLGLWRDVSIQTTGAVTLRSPAVSTHFLKDDLSEASLRIVADLDNHSGRPITTIISAAIGPIHLQQRVELAAHETHVVLFDAEQFPSLRVRHPAVWWPRQYGAPQLETLTMTARVGSLESDDKTVRFGIREISAAPNPDGFLQFQINHRSILIRGGGWTPDLFYREPRERLRQELEYVLDMHLNAIRLEGKLGSDELFDLADEMGILVMAGWQCCDAWQRSDKWAAREHTIALDSTYDQVSRLRSHASLLVWLNGSDEVPAPQVEREFLAVLKERAWPNPVLSTAADRTSTVSGKSGVKMSGPYDYVPPEYWYLDKDRLGGAFGFNTETSPGPAIPTASAIRRTLPEKSWWPIDEQWNYHAGLGKFAQYTRFTNAMIATYGAASTLEEYAFKAQLMSYDGERAMFEAYAGKKYRATGVIQWMLNNAWPSFIWHLYDYYLVPGGGYFGAKKANEPVHIQYGYDDRSVDIVNSTLIAYQNLHASAKVLDLQGKQVFAEDCSVSVGEDGVARAFSIPETSGTVFLKLQLRDVAGETVSDNLYTIPAKLAQLDWDKSTYVNTPAIRYADMRDLAQLPTVEVRTEVNRAAGPGETSIRLINDGKATAFFLYLRAVKKGTDDDVTPVFWNDNFISLLPGESKVLVVNRSHKSVDIKLQGWNVQPRTIHP